MQSSTPNLRASDAIPFLFRFIITTLEPFFALGGAILTLTDPGSYLATMTRHTATFKASDTFLYTELAGAWLYFSFNEAVVLRLYDDLRLWRILCFGMLLSDIAYCHSAAQAVGGWGAWLILADWSREDWVVFWTTAPMVLSRVLIVLGIGLKSTGVRVKPE